MSAGGLDTTKEFIDMLKLQRAGNNGGSVRVLDVGSGIGGSSFYFASEYGCEVVSLDLSTTSIDLAKQRIPDSISHLVTFVLGDALEMDYDECYFDVVYSRDALLHVPYSKKLDLWRLFHKWLKPAGQLLITDYGCGEGEISDEMKTYMSKRKYALLSPTKYEELTREAGFEDVDCQERTFQYCQIARREIGRIKPGEFDEEFSKEQREGLVKVFDDKVEMCLRGDRTFILLHAKKQPSYYEHRKRVLKACKGVFTGGLVMGTDGNVSERIVGTDLMAIKGSGIPYEELTVHDIVVCKIDGTMIPGEKKPSSEFGLHSGIYKARPDVNSVVHTHSNFASVLACARKDIPCFHYSVAEVAGDTDVVKCAEYHTYGTPELAEAVIKAIGPSYGCLMANHGQATCGPDIDSALYYALRLENLCMQYVHVLSIGGAVNLGKKEMDECRERDKTYGQVEDGDGTGHGLGCCK